MLDEVTFEGLARLDPRLGELAADAAQDSHEWREWRDCGGWCPVVHYRRHFRSRVWWLVGDHRKGGGDDAAAEAVLRSPAAFDVVTAHIRGVLGGLAGPPVVRAVCDPVVKTVSN